MHKMLSAKQCSSDCICSSGLGKGGNLTKMESLEKASESWRMSLGMKNIISSETEVAAEGPGGGKVTRDGGGLDVWYREKTRFRNHRMSARE